ncbi:TRAFAC clade GTPase domain-containing protein [Actinomadura decatromicini]|uniref:Double-GTPase 2 domain-containing protein n=1 Tax=Actinomadura decatromicini TaxID=2604572 RepID=A0A5D3F8Y9_9ACTN|nr:hypothetical protein [Actinomadura decatromicini]TYK44296.1 hypothetical protein FXF68_32935 [Actinomadura decatromicini]
MLHQVMTSVLGASGSGKSTYLLALYATMSRGVNTCTLHEVDSNRDVELSDGWRDLGESGRPPEQTGAAPRQHVFVYSRDMKRLANLHWTDFRGGALASFVGPDGSPDAADMLRQVSLAHGVFLVVDGEHFRKPIAPNQREAVSRDSLLQRMSSVLTDTLTGRTAAGRPLPAITILITKADLIEWNLPGASRRLEDLVAEIRSLLPVAFQRRVCTAVCPVSVGPLESVASGAVRPDSVAPDSVHLPVMFTLAHFYRQERDSLGERLKALAAERAAVDGELRTLPPGGSRSLAARRDRLIGALRALDEQQASAGHWRGHCAAEAEALVPMLRHLMIYDGGRLATWAGVGRG